MLRPSKKMLFAIEAVLDIAYHAGGEPVQSREITRRLRLHGRKYRIKERRAVFYGFKLRHELIGI